MSYEIFQGHYLVPSPWRGFPNMKLGHLSLFLSLPTEAEERKKWSLIIFHHLPSFHPSRASLYPSIKINLITISMYFLWILFFDISELITIVFLMCFKIILLFLFCHSAACRNLDPWSGTEPACPATVMQRPSHCTIREVPGGGGGGGGREERERERVCVCVLHLCLLKTATNKQSLYKKTWTSTPVKQ